MGSGLKLQGLGVAVWTGLGVLNPKPLLNRKLPFCRSTETKISTPALHPGPSQQLRQLRAKPYTLNPKKYRPVRAFYGSKRQCNVFVQWLLAGSWV